MLTSKIRINPVSSIEFDFTGDKVSFKGELNKDGSPKLLPIDQFSGQPFMENECGWIKNDIQAYEDSQNDSVARAILQRCPVFTQDKPDNMSVDERLSEVIPSNISSPAEFVRISKHIASVRYQRAVEREKLPAEAAAKMSKVKSQPKKVDVVQDSKPE